MGPTAATLLAVALVSVVSLVGALAFLLPGLRRHRVLLALVAVAAGTLVGDAFFHILPESVESWQGRGIDRMGLLLVGGFLLLFALEVALRSRHAHLELIDEAEHGHTHEHSHGAPKIAPYAWMNLVGDGIHNLLDGAVIATAFLVDTPLGLATTLAVVVHEVPQELGDFAVLLRAGLKPSRALLFNFGSAVLAVLGAVAVLALPVDASEVELYGLPLVAGAFLYIAAADLVPELHHHSRGRDAVLILLGFVVGLAIMYGILALEGTGLLG